MGNSKERGNRRAAFNDRATSEGHAIPLRAAGRPVLRQPPGKNAPRDAVTALSRDDAGFRLILSERVRKNRRFRRALSAEEH